MSRSNKIRKSSIIGGVLLAAASYVFLNPGSYIEEKLNLGYPEFSEEILSEHEAPWPYSAVEWRLSEEVVQEKTIPGALEDIVYFEAPIRKLSEWEITSLARLVPLKSLIEENADYYELNPMWLLQFYTLESSLNPGDINTKSDDYGLGQIKLDSAALARKICSDPQNRFYNPSLDLEKNLFDPETNIIMSSMFMRRHAETLDLDTSDHLYAVYYFGTNSVDEEKNIHPGATTQVDALKERYGYYSGVIPYFRIPKEEVAARVENPDARELLRIYHTEPTAEGRYEQSLHYFLSELESSSRASTREVLMVDDCLTFAKILDMAWGHDMQAPYEEIAHRTEELYSRTNNPDMRSRLSQTLTLTKRQLAQENTRANKVLAANKASIEDGLSQDELQERLRALSRRAVEK